MRSWSTFQKQNSWNNLQNKPAILTDDQINWSEIQNKPIIETGTFNPKLETMAGFQYTHSVRLGKYQRIGNFVSFDVRLSMITVTGGLSSPMIISGFPFTFSDQNFIGGMLHNFNGLFIPLFFTIANTATVEIKVVSSTTTATLITLTGTGISPNVTAWIYCSGQAFIA